VAFVPPSATTRFVPIPSADGVFPRATAGLAPFPSIGELNASFERAVACGGGAENAALALAATTTLPPGVPGGGCWNRPRPGNGAAIAAAATRDCGVTNGRGAVVSVFGGADAGTTFAPPPTPPSSPKKFAARFIASSEMGTPLPEPVLNPANAGVFVVGASFSFSLAGGGSGVTVVVATTSFIAVSPPRKRAARAMLSSETGTIFPLPVEKPENVGAGVFSTTSRRGIGGVSDAIATVAFGPRAGFSAVSSPNMRAPFRSAATETSIARALAVVNPDGVRSSAAPAAAPAKDVDFDFDFDFAAAVSSPPHAAGDAASPPHANPPNPPYAVSSSSPSIAEGSGNGDRPSTLASNAFPPAVVIVTPRAGVPSAAASMFFMRAPPRFAHAASFVFGDGDGVAPGGVLARAASV
jgi:hypothetical protein